MRLISLASGTLPEFDPVTVIESAAAAGFSGCGVWYDAKTWSAATSSAVRTAFERTGLKPLEMEVLVVGERNPADHGLGLLEAAAEVGVEDVLVVSRDTDAGCNLEAFARLADAAAARSLYLNLEFLPIFGIRALPADCFRFAQFCDAWQTARHDGSFEAL
jgi:sugar phosphate isomerase/epimerase